MAVFRSPLFRKLLISTFVLIACPLLVLDSFFTSFVAKQETKNAQHRLAAEARILRGELLAVDPAFLANWAKIKSMAEGARLASARLWGSS